MREACVWREEKNEDGVPADSLLDDVLCRRRAHGSQPPDSPATANYLTPFEKQNRKQKNTYAWRLACKPMIAGSLSKTEVQIPCQNQTVTHVDA